MYWLCFYNSYDKPDIECAFSCAFMLVEHVENCPGYEGRYSCYTVFTPQGEVIYLNKFISDYKEDQNK